MKGVQAIILLFINVKIDALRMIDIVMKARALRAASLVKLHGLSQAQIAEAVGASQPQVSRVLQGQGLRRSRVYEDVCLYVERFDHGVSEQAVQECGELISALKDTWDGTAGHARALATVIRSLRVLGPARVMGPEVQGMEQNR